MENEIKRLIKKWDKSYRIIQSYDNACEDIEEDLQSLLEFKQKKCCGKIGNGETITLHTEK